MVKLYKRLLAYIIDIIIVSFIIIYPFKKYIAVSTFAEIKLNTIIPYVITLLLTILYFAVFEFYFQQTVGKMIMRIKIKSKSKKLEFNQCFIRSISKISSILYILDLLYLLKNRKQRYLECKTNTETIQK